MFVYECLTGARAFKLRASSILSRRVSLKPPSPVGLQCAHFSKTQQSSKSSGVDGSTKNAAKVAETVITPRAVDYSAW